MDDATKSIGAQASLLREDLSHKQISTRLGIDEDYTGRVDTFIQRQLPP